MRNAETVLGVIQITGEPREIERLTRGSEGGRWKSARMGNSLAVYPTARPVVCPAKAGVFSRRESCQSNSQKLCRLESRRTGNEPSEASRQDHRWDGGESPGRSASERTGGPENEEPRRPSLQPERRRLYGPSQPG